LSQAPLNVTLIKGAWEELKGGSAAKIFFRRSPYTLRPLPLPEDKKVLRFGIPRFSSRIFLVDFLVIGSVSQNTDSDFPLVHFLLLEKSVFPVSTVSDVYSGELVSTRRVTLRTSCKLIDSCVLRR